MLRFLKLPHRRSALPPRPFLQQFARLIRWLALGILALALLLAAGLLWYRQASLPQADGSQQLAGLSGLSAAVDIVRDAEGVPHIYAKSARDAWFAMGYVHAQDRLWQMEMNRRIAAGRTAEILGAQALPTDRFLRVLGVRRNATAIWSRLAPDTRETLQAYADGVNAWLVKRTGPLPPEFLLTGAPAPEPWHPVDSISWQTMMAWDLAGNWKLELLRMQLAQRLSVEQINVVLPPYPGDAVPVTRDYTQLYRELQASTAQLGALATIAPDSYVEGKGSNNWVVGGSRSTSGKPLLANDPHLGLSAPALWYLAHVSAPGLNAIGASLPGLPGIVLGHNGSIAWGFTNTGPDVQDLYLERTHPSDPAQYQTPDGWASFATHSERIKVKGTDDVVLQVRASRHGPVISDAMPSIAKIGKDGLDASRHVVAMAWTALRPDDLTLQAGLRINRAQNWQQFLAAVRDFSSPQQNMVYADVQGNIGFVAPGRVPVRKPGNDLHGLAPAPGWDARYDWDGFIPFEQLPQQFNPASAMLLSANEKIIGPDYPHFLTSEWAPPYRAQRIRSLLAAEKQHDLSGFARMQKDQVSLAALEMLPILRKTVARSERASKALQLLAQWQGDMAIERPEPLIYSAWIRSLSQHIFADEMTEPLLRRTWELRHPQQAVLNVLHNKDGQQAWCRDVLANGAQQTCSDVLAASLEKTLDGLVSVHGTDIAQWRWGDAHMARSVHRPFSRVPLLSDLFEIRVPSAGDNHTINVGRSNLHDEKAPFVNVHAAGLRALYELSDLENSRFMISTGQSGNLLSPHYRNLAQPWANVSYLPMKTNRAVIQAGPHSTLRLLPQ